MKISEKELTNKNREIFKNNLGPKEIGNVFAEVIDIQKKQGIAPFPLFDGRDYWSEGAQAKELDNSGLCKIYNLGRNLGKRPVSKKDCRLCISQRIGERDIGIIIDNEWEAKANTFPIFEKHGTIIHRDHIKQSLDKKDIDKILNWLIQSPDTKFFYNGIRAGATELNHKHFQYFIGTEPYKELSSLNGKMPIEILFEKGNKELLKEKHGINLFRLTNFPSPEKQIIKLVLEAKMTRDPFSGKVTRGLTSGQTVILSDSEESRCANELTRILKIIQINEMDYNILWTISKCALSGEVQNIIRIFICPRTKQKLVSQEIYDKLTNNDKKWAVVIPKRCQTCVRDIPDTSLAPERSLATIEFSGLFICFNKEQYENLTYDDFVFVISELGLKAESAKADGLLKKLKN